MNTIYLPDFLKYIFNYFVIMLYVFHSHFDTTIVYFPHSSLHQMLSCIFFCYPFPSSTMNPIVGKKKKNSPFLFFYLFLFLPLLFSIGSHFSTPSLGGHFYLGKMLNIDPSLAWPYTLPSTSPFFPIYMSYLYAPSSFPSIF